MCKGKFIMNVTVSIIVPIYNTNIQLLKKCLQSCIDQTYSSIEILLICNGTPRSVFEYVNQWKNVDKRVKIFDLKEKGVSYARNYGISQSTGEWLMFLDSDDWIENNYCEIMLENLRQYKYDIDIITCSFYKNYSQITEICRITDTCAYMDSHIFLNKILDVKSGVGFAWAKLWKKEFIIKNNLLFNTKLIVAEDAEFCIRSMNCSPRIIILPDILYHYVFSNESTVRKFNVNYALQYEEAMNSIFYLLGDNQVIKKNLYNFIAYHMLLVCVNYCFNPQNGLSYNQQKNLLKNEIQKNIFREAIISSDLESFSLSRKITLFCLKKHLYFLVKVISYIRHTQR